MQLNNDTAALIGFGCEALVYGAYIIIYVLSMVFLHGGHRSQTNKLMSIFTTVLFVLCTTHFALEFNHFYNVLGSTGVVEGFALETRELFAADILISVIDLCGDIILLHRCWLVWGKNYFIIILPFLTAVGGFACGMTGLGILLNINPTAPQAPPEVRPLGTAAFSLPLATNFLVTIFTVVRLYMLARRARGITSENALNNSTSSYVNKAAAIVIESGMLYLAAQLVFVVLFAIGHPAQGIAATIAVQIYGIAPTLISFRVGLGVATEEYEMSTKRSGAEWRLSTRRGMPTNATGISIHTTQEITGDSTSDLAIYSNSKDTKDLRLGDRHDFRDSGIPEGKMV